MNGPRQQLRAALSPFDQRPRRLIEGIGKDESRQAGSRADVHNVSREHLVRVGRKSNKPHGVVAMGFAFATELARSNPLQQNLFG
jgi:hypothetical protein